MKIIYWFHCYVGTYAAIPWKFMIEAFFALYGFICAGIDICVRIVPTLLAGWVIYCCKIWPPSYYNYYAAEFLVEMF